MMNGVDPSPFNSVPLSKADTAGNPFLSLCSLLNSATALTASCAIMLDLILLFSVNLQGAEATLHCFGVPMAGAIILAEREVGVVLRLGAFLDSWLLKGFYISLTWEVEMSGKIYAPEEMEELFELWKDDVVINTSEGALRYPCPRNVKGHCRVGTLLLAFDHPHARTLDLWRFVCGSGLIVAGVMYVAMGALCFRQLRSYQLGKIKRKKVKLMRQEMLTLSAQKQEIEKLLADTESKLQLL